MRRVKITVDLPSGLSLSSVKLCLDQLIDGHVRERNRDRHADKILKSDAAFAKYFGVLPVVRACTYKTVHRNQEGWYAEFHGDSRRPVAMRAALQLLIKGRHWQRQVIERFIKRSRLTFFDAERWFDFQKSIVRRLRQKPYGVGNWLLDFGYESPGEHFGLGHAFAWIGGRHQSYTIHQFRYLRRLYSVIERTQKLEEHLTAFQTISQPQQKDFDKDVKFTALHHLQLRENAARESAS